MQGENVTTTVRRPLAEVEQDAASAGGERREGLRLVVTGRVLLLFTLAPREYAPRGGGPAAMVLPFKVWTPRGGELWCEVRAPEHIALIQGLTEGGQVQVAGQLVVKARRLGGHFVTLRCYEVASVL